MIAPALFDYALRLERGLGLLQLGLSAGYGFINVLEPALHDARQLLRADVPTRLSPGSDDAAGKLPRLSPRRFSLEVGRRNAPGQMKWN